MSNPIRRPDKNNMDRNDNQLRFYVALLLISAYVLLLLLLPWVPAAREPLLFLGPVTGAIVGYAFGHQSDQERH
jgi:hypothetical protein